jgi:two-component system sensor histidine kinase SenX3
MVVAGRRRSIAFFIALGVGLISVILLLYIGWVLLNWRTGILLFLGILLLTIIAGVVLNTTFLVREIRRNEQHDAFINAVTHELKTPVASIRLYLETLQTRPVDESKKQEFYRSCCRIATGCSPPSSRCCAPDASVPPAITS